MDLSGCPLRYNQPVWFYIPQILIHKDETRATASAIASLTSRPCGDKKYNKDNFVEKAVEFFRSNGVTAKFIVGVAFTSATVFSAKGTVEVDDLKSTDSPSIAASAAVPQLGDKLGYTKEISISLLDIKIRRILDGVLALYYEPRLFTNRVAAVSALGGKLGERTWLPPISPPGTGPRRFFEDFTKEGVFSDEALSGRFSYYVWSTKPPGEAWSAAITVRIRSELLCINSRAVEGYVDLTLDSGIFTSDHYGKSESWDRHKAGGSPFAKRISDLTPGLIFNFFKGCLTQIGISERFLYKDVSDEHVFD